MQEGGVTSGSSDTERQLAKFVQACFKQQFASWPVSMDKPSNHSGCYHKG